MMIKELNRKKQMIKNAVFSLGVFEVVGGGKPSNGIIHVGYLSFSKQPLNVSINKDTTQEIPFFIPHRQFHLIVPDYHAVLRFAFHLYQ